ncbi:Rv3654c family TadE-like protein [Kocuria massiliensis]|uniref:Rv3654c family TadE-like protein n=1 Tax=Kocuria massiliensis TaxID=1926282 RepID=UPI000A1CB2DA|nr:Rv3654c family TadE-like protein [Kocuria massiliensis]MCT1367954.1 pilus assembly protein TadG-related protein [Rothia sp. p3-SID1597]
MMQSQRAQSGSSRRNDPPDRGSGTVLAVAVVALIIGLAVGVAVVGQVAAAHHRARTAADLAALAAADAARGLLSGAPCDVGRKVVEENGARLVQCCSPQGRADVIDVRTHVDLPSWLRRLGPVAGVARAGPPAGDDGPAHSADLALCA